MTFPLGPVFRRWRGLGHNIVPRPKGSTEVETHTSGREVLIGYWTYPLYEWNLTFSVLRNFQACPPPPGIAPGIASELKCLKGYFLWLSASLTNLAFPGSR
jgi:hypothetical protein